MTLKNATCFAGTQYCATKFNMNDASSKANTIATARPRRSQNADTRNAIPPTATYTQKRLVITIVARANVGRISSGIAGEAMDKVATPFFTTRKQGTGLGLPLADLWVTRHGGRLRIESPPREGTRVTAYLPLRRIE